MGLIKRKMSKALERKKARGDEGAQKSKRGKILTAEGWKRLMLGKRRKGSKASQD